MADGRSGAAAPGQSEQGRSAEGGPEHAAGRRARPDGDACRVLPDIHDLFSSSSTLVQGPPGTPSW
ncbi:hypothetical protein PACID_22610 [Acidipropionibacterium acidipropionici ATCC 4875]|uniref:Uncharacterized protein n=1 Tax=Acidipropionibacterium acidipropionici (strain ATCC 4875 / DSM 20272 / JCM 6432 / NBRC 12425 / NCIMB 8070 / 4) TaxID=1171373 RepID=K7SL78_ACIA4|nr:hypothetical protein PACID_22610 [Acidipropionibacterium acidipropionici ATCC 4875]